MKYPSFTQIFITQQLFNICGNIIYEIKAECQGYLVVSILLIVVPIILPSGNRDEI